MVWSLRILCLDGVLQTATSTRKHTLSSLFPDSSFRSSWSISSPTLWSVTKPPTRKVMSLATLRKTLWMLWLGVFSPIGKLCNQQWLTSLHLWFGRTRHLLGGESGPNSTTWTPSPTKYWDTFTTHSTWWMLWTTTTSTATWIRLSTSSCCRTLQRSLKFSKLNFSIESN